MAEPILALDIVGTSGLRQSGGWILEEFLKQLRGPKGIELIKEMTWNNPQAGAVRTLIHTLSRQVKWEVEAAENPLNLDMAKMAQDLVESCMSDMEHSWHDFLAEVMSFADYGYSFHEILYKLRRGPKGLPITRSKHNDGMWGWRKIELRSQDSLDHWEFDKDTGDILGFWQRDPYANSYKFIDSGRAIHFRTEKFKNNPEGRSLFRNAVISYLRLKHIEDVESMGVERDLAGMPFMQVPQEIMAASPSAEHLAIRRALETQLGQIKRDQREYIMMPAEKTSEGKDTGYKFQLLSSSGTRQLDIVNIKNSFKTDILMSVLAQFLQLGVASPNGSRSLASSSTDLFTLSQGALLDNIEETINRQLVDPLCELNNIDVHDRPRVKHGDIETPPMEELGAILQTLFTTGMLQTDEALKQRVYELVNLPYTPPVAIMPGMPGAVKPAAQIIAEAMGQTPPGATKTGTPAQPGPGSQPGAKPAQQLIDEAMGT